MPAYEYHCRNCEASTEILQKSNDQPLTVCPHCGQASLKSKVGSGIIFSLKGTHDGSYTHCACGCLKVCVDKRT